MFAALVVERAPLSFEDAPALIRDWTQIAGGWAAFAVYIWLLLVLTRAFPLDWRKVPRRQAIFFCICAIISAVCYVIAAPTYLPGIFGTMADVTSAVSPGFLRFQSILLTVGGLCALAAACTNFVVNLTHMRFRRLDAVSRLSFKEALRRRVPYAFVILLLVFLFGNWYVPYKPDDQVRTYVGLVDYAMVRLLLLSALVLAAFSIPTDIRQQTIQTILTKPVERFEVVLGRFAGFVALLTVILFVMTTLCLIYVLRNIDPAAAAESLMARVPGYGILSFENTTKPDRGESVGREWDYRSYIGGPNPPKPAQVAVWNYAALPAEVASRPFVRCEFGFDIYRLDKGFENRGISCTFVFQTWQYKKSDKEAYDKRRQELLNNPDMDNILAEEFGYYEKVSKTITDFHTQSIDVPGKLFRNALKEPPSGAAGTPPIQVRVKNDSRSGEVGMAPHDLYFRLDNPEGGYETLRFAWNFYKSSIGLWFQMVLVCGLAVFLSTYLSGVIAFLLALLIYTGGWFHEFIRSVGEGKNFGGGPLEALFRIASRQNISAPLEDSSVAKFAVVSDQGFRWMIRRVQDVLPDVENFSLGNYVAEGFNIPGAQLWMSLLVLIGYLLPWAVLAYYLIKWREIASQT
jgi:ABC-type transport system involved in multi-copper enzyme maturation permease subunit